ncbi:hypothetical protein BGW41_007126 [Actinomortierella wolfii]|nr:hypothetical protein BGW41_007126 [Actinomortierella wolfii]
MPHLRRSAAARTIALVSSPVSKAGQQACGSWRSTVSVTAAVRGRRPLTTDQGRNSVQCRTSPSTPLTSTTTPGANLTASSARQGSRWSSRAQYAGSSYNGLWKTLIHPHHQLQKRDLSFLGTLRAVFKQPVPPKAPKPRPDAKKIQGRTRIDEYSWMHNKNSPELRKYIEAENSYANDYFASDGAAVHLLSRELTQVLRTKKISEPVVTVVKGFEYYTRTSRYGMIYCRRKRTPMAQEEIMLDSKYLPEYCNVKKVLLSTSHNIFAFLTEDEGEELGALHFRDLDRAQPFDEVLEDVFNFVWGSDDKTVYYTRANQVLRPYQVWAHKVGTPQSEDILVYQDDDDSIFIDVGATKDQKYITINANSLSSSEVRILDAGFNFFGNKDQPEGSAPKPTLRLVEPRQEGVEYYVDHHDDHFYILTNANPKKNFRVMRVPDATPGREHWEELMESKDGEKIEDVDIFKNYAVIYSKRNALPVISCYHFASGNVHEVPLPEQFCSIGAGVNLDYDTDTFQFTLNSPYAHEATYAYDMAARVITPLRVHPIHRFDRSKYTCTRIEVTAQDGKTQIPVTLLHKKTMQLNGRNPTLMRAYGAYGVSTEIDFRVEHFPLLDRGWIIALAHVRGGSELGSLWYHEGKLDNKINTLTDFINVAEHLVQQGYTNPRRLTAIGTSAGGLLMGAVSNMRPDLFRAMIWNVPFLDPITAMLDPEIPLTKVEYHEWGNPAESQRMYDYMVSYAPYDTIPDARRLQEQQLGTQQQTEFVSNAQSSDKKAKGDSRTASEESASSSSLHSSSPATSTAPHSSSSPLPPPPLTSRRPALLITAGERDQRVDWTQATKYVARLRSRLEAWYGPEGKETCLLMVDENRGHFTNGTQDDRVRAWAREVVFLLSLVQMGGGGGSGNGSGLNGGL